MSKSKFHSRDDVLASSARGDFDFTIDAIKDNFVCLCARCGYSKKVEPCSNCGSNQFTGGYNTEGTIGLMCQKCHLVQTRWKCPQCGTDNSVMASFGVFPSGCFIATAAFESVNTPEVVFLRGFRDNTLSKLIVGRCFIHIYQRTSPPFADIVSRSQSLKRISRFILRSLIKILRNTKANS